MAFGPRPEPVAACRRHRVGRRHIRISAVIDVEQRALRAFEQNTLTLAPLDVEQRPDRIHVRQNLRRDRGEILVDRRTVEFRKPEATAQRIVMGKQPLDLWRQRRQIGQIHEPNGAPADFILISRADAAFGGADAGRRIVGLAKCIELLMQRQDQRCVLGDTQIIRGHRNALFLELGDFIDQRLRIDHHAIADNGELATAHHAGRQQRQFVGDAIDHQSVAGIMSPWNRTTISACSDSQSTILPLPSSPHCDPTTTTFAIRLASLRQRSGHWRRSSPGRSTFG